MSEHVGAGQWPVLLSAEVGDAERLAAERHAESCETCSSEAAQARTFLSILSTELTALASPGPAPRALSRAKSRIVRELVRPWLVPQPARWKALWAILGFGILVGMARQRALDGTSLLVSAVLLAVAVAGLSGNRWPGMFWGLPLVLYFPVRLLADNAGFEIGHGINCSLAELFAAALPVGALWVVVRRGTAALPSDFARAAIGGALAGQAALALTCPSHSLGHLVVFHSTVVVAAGLMGAMIGKLAKPATA